MPHVVLVSCKSYLILIWYRSAWMLFRFSFVPPNGFKPLLPFLFISLSSIMVSNKVFLFFVVWIYTFSHANPIILSINTKPKLFWSLPFFEQTAYLFRFYWMNTNISGLCKPINFTGYFWAHNKLSRTLYTQLRNFRYPVNF